MVARPTSLAYLPSVWRRTQTLHRPLQYYSTLFWQGRGARARQGKSPRTACRRPHPKSRAESPCECEHLQKLQSYAILHRQPSIRLAAAPGEDRGRAAMALAALSGDEQCIIFSQLCNAHARHSVAPWVPGRQRHSRRRCDAVAFTLQVRV